MSKGKEFLQKHKKLFVIHLMAVGVLLLELVLCRYVFFEVHGLKEWPYDLFKFGLVGLVFSLLAGKMYAPWITSVSYLAWFVLGVIFNQETVDAHGTRGDLMPFIWLWGFLASILVGFLFEVILKWYRLLKKH